MKFTISTAASILTFLSLSSALPTESIVKREETVRPTVTSQYSVWTGAINYKTSQGLIQKTGITSDITTLVTFDIPSSAAGKQCELVFTLGSYNWPTGTATFDVFTSIKPATAPSASWPPGNLRDQYLGRLKAVNNGPAQNVEGFQPVVGQKIPCPAGQTLAGELVGAGDQVYIRWDVATEGPYIKIT